MSNTTLADLPRNKVATAILVVMIGAGALLNQATSPAAVPNQERQTMTAEETLSAIHGA